MICDKCKNRCDLCGQPINPFQFPGKGWQPTMPEPNKVWCGDMPNFNATCESDGFLGELMKEVRDCKHD